MLSTADQIIRAASFESKGFIGRHLVDELLNQWQIPVMLVRPGSEAKVRHDKGCELVTSTIEDPEAMILRDCENRLYVNSDHLDLTSGTNEWRLR